MGEQDPDVLEVKQEARILVVHAVFWEVSPSKPIDFFFGTNSSGFVLSVSDKPCGGDPLLGCRVDMQIACSCSRKYIYGTNSAGFSKTYLLLVSALSGLYSRPQ